MAGLTALDERSWRTWWQDPDFVPAGGESLAAVCTRVREACVELADDAARGDVVVVSHVPVLLAFSDAGPVDRSDRADR